MTHIKHDKFSDPSSPSYIPIKTRADYCRRQVARWKDGGLCSRCGGRELQVGYTTCDKCLEYQKRMRANRPRRVA